MGECESSLQVASTFLSGKSTERKEGEVDVGEMKKEKRFESFPAIKKGGPFKNLNFIMSLSCKNPSLLFL